MKEYIPDVQESFYINYEMHVGVKGVFVLVINLKGKKQNERV